MPDRSNFGPDDQTAQSNFDILLENSDPATTADFSGLTSATSPSAPLEVECLGQTFASEQARRDHFLELLRSELPRLRQVEGFPIGTDDDILALSDPPYYTACPNPFLTDFVRFYGQPYDPAQPYRREPFAADVSEGKSGPIYDAHSYHTKVPHKAIMRYILHYTEPGDLVFDGFCGTGMTGVAAQLCGDRATVESLSYRVQPDGSILDADGQPFAKLGARRAILNDLSPAASFIAYNYNTPVNVAEFEREARRILQEVEAECGWMYETIHSDGQTKGRINYVIWSDVFICSNCAEENVYWYAAIEESADKENLNKFSCLYCNSILTKDKLKHSWVTRFDTTLNQTIEEIKKIPVIINYRVGKKRFSKKPDAFDLELLKKVEETEILTWLPNEQLPNGQEIKRLKLLKLFNVLQLLPKRSTYVLSNVLTKSKSIRTKFLVTSVLLNSSWMYRWRANGKGGITSGTYYIGSTPQESNTINQLIRKLSDISRMSNIGANNIITTQASQSFKVPDASFDYIFLDPPFGKNLMYSELNFLWEAWLKVFTNNKQEAIENKVQGKSLDDYRALMTRCFEEAYRILKPGRWMTVEFSNTQASVWNSIQTALQEAGFVVANVSALDKKQGSFKAVTTTTAVKQDLVISAYKPNGGLEARFEEHRQTVEGVWDFVASHLRYLPVFKANKDGAAEFLTERDPRILYDRVIAYYVRHIASVPLDSAEFQAGLKQRFAERVFAEGAMYFLTEQAVEYDGKKAKATGDAQRSYFVQDERSAIDWLRDFLKRKPSLYTEIQPEYLQQIAAGWQKYEAQPELIDLLEANFLRYEPGETLPPQLISWLNLSSVHRPTLAALASEVGADGSLKTSDPALLKAVHERWYVPDLGKQSDLEKAREKKLLQEYAGYRASTKRKLDKFRLEVLRAGFKRNLADKEFQAIVDVAAKIPGDILLSDMVLTMLFDQAQLGLGI